MRKVVARCVVGVIVVVGFVTPATVAYALWIDTASSTVHVTVTAPPPVGPTAPTLKACRPGDKKKTAILEWVTASGVNYSLVDQSTSQTLVPNASSPFEFTNQNNNFNIVVRATDPATNASTDSARHFAVQLAAGLCEVLP